MMVYPALMVFMFFLHVMKEGNGRKAPVSLGFLLLVQLVKLEQGDVGNVAFVIHAVVVGKIIQV